MSSRKIDTIQNRSNHGISYNEQTDELAVTNGLDKVEIRDIDDYTVKNTLEFTLLDELYSPNISYSPDGEYLAVTDRAGSVNAVIIYETADYTETDRVEVDSSPRSVTWRDDGEKICFATFSSGLFIYDIGDSSVDANPDMPDEDSVTSTDWIDNEKVLTGGDNVYIYDSASDSFQQLDNLYDGFVTTVAVSPDQNYAGIGYTDEAHAIDLNTENTLYSETTTGRVSSIDFSADSRYMIYSDGRTTETTDLDYDSARSSPVSFDVEIKGSAILRRIGWDFDGSADDIELTIEDSSNETLYELSANSSSGRSSSVSPYEYERIPKDEVITVRIEWSGSAELNVDTTTSIDNEYGFVDSGQDIFGTIDGNNPPRIGFESVQGEVYEVGTDDWNEIKRFTPGDKYRPNRLKFRGSTEYFVGTEQEESFTYGAPASLLDGSINASSSFGAGLVAPSFTPREGEVNIVVDDVIFDSYQGLKLEKRLNEVDTFEFTAFITDDADRGLISEGQDILVFEDQEFIFKGRIEDTDYNSSFEVKVEGEGMATKLLDRKTDRDSFDNTAADQIIQEIIPLDTVSEGVIEEAPLTSLSFDHDNIARAVAGAANAVGFDWRLRQEEDDDYDTDFVDFRERIGSETVVETFKIGENARLMENEQDDGFVANDITLLGRGDGINQLEARVFAAAEEFTQLQAEISEEETDNLTVDDTTVLGDTGDTIIAKAGAELINCTIDDATTLSINERGVENWEGEETPQILHRENISVWLYENITQGLGPFTPENQGSAQEGSSIADKGVKQLRETDKTVVKLPTLEQVADRELRNRFRSVQSVRVRTAEPRIGSAVGLGDEIEVTGDLGTDLTGEYRVVGIDLNRRSSEEGTELICANRPRRLVERLSEIERDRDTLNAHMQGATNIDSVSFSDNCNEEFALSSDLYVPEDSVAVNKMDLTFKRESFRGYIEPDSTSGGQIKGAPVERIDSSFSSEPLTAGDGFKTIDTFNISEEHDRIHFYITVEGTFEDNDIAIVDARVQNTDASEFSEQYLPQQDGTPQKTIKDDFEGGQTTVISVPYDASGDNLELQVRADAGGSSIDATIEAVVVAESKHNHQVITGDEDYGIFEPDTEQNVDVDVVVDGNVVETVSGVAVGDEVSEPISLKQDLTEPIAGEYHSIRLEPSGRCRLKANVFQKVFIESTL